MTNLLERYEGVLLMMGRLGTRSVPFGHAFVELALPAFEAEFRETPGGRHHVMLAARRTDETVPGRGHDGARHTRTAGGDLACCDELGLGCVVHLRISKIGRKILPRRNSFARGDCGLWEDQWEALNNPERYSDGIVQRLLRAHGLLPLV